MAINCSRYTMHLIKILITITSPLCILEKKRSCNHLENMFKNLLEDYKRTKRTLRDKKRKVHTFKDNYPWLARL